MELRKFITTALLDIIGGVEDAQKKIEYNGVVPNIGTSHKAVEYGVSDLQSVDFEVSISTDESSGKEGELGVISSFIGAGVSGKSSSDLSNMSRLKFKVPIKLPVSKIT